MPLCYADSSVLVKRHVRETGSQWVEELFERSSTVSIATSRVSMVEVFSAFYRRMRDADIGPTECLAIAEDFKRISLAEYELIELTSQVVEQSDILLRYHPLRAYDSIQLASAISARESFMKFELPPPTFLTADDKLLMAARAEGFETDNPNFYA